MPDQEAHLIPFKQLTYQRPDMAQVENQLRRARLRLRLAMNPDSAFSAFDDMQKVQKNYRMAAALARIRSGMPATASEYAAETAFFNQADAQFDHQLQQFYAALLSTRHRPALEGKYGRHLFRKADSFRSVFQPDVMHDLFREKELVNDYGEWLNLEPDQTLADPDRLLRRQAHLALDAHLNGLSGQLDELFVQLVHCRKQLAAKLGFAGFSDLAYRRLERFDYGREQLETVRSAVLRYIVPLTREVRHLQRRRLKVEHLAWYDLPCLLPESKQQLLMDDRELVSLADDVLVKLSGQSPSVVRQMRDGGYLTVETGKQARSGFACTLLPQAFPYLVMPFTKTGHDAAMLLQATGLAYALTRYKESQDILEYFPAPEIRLLAGHAMGYLAMTRLEPAFGTGHDDYILLQLTEALLAIPHDCLIDEFEHRIYEMDDVNAGQLNKLWQELERKYVPDLDYEQAPFFTSGRGWQAQPQLWQAPHSRINRVLAQLTALDLWRVSQSNPAAAWRHYDKLCTLGGSDATLGLLQQAGLASPFDPDSIKKVAYAVCDTLAL
jgi:M3 family oligoendopeptidase